MLYNSAMELNSSPMRFPGKYCFLQANSLPRCKPVRWREIDWDKVFLPVASAVSICNKIARKLIKSAYVPSRYPETVLIRWQLRPRPHPRLTNISLLLHLRSTATRLRFGNLLHSSSHPSSVTVDETYKHDRGRQLHGNTAHTY